MTSATTEAPLLADHTESADEKHSEEWQFMITNLKRLVAKISVLLGMGAVVLFASSTAEAQQLDLADSPLFLTQTAAPLNLLVLGRDHKLYYEAYND